MFKCDQSDSGYRMIRDEKAQHVQPFMKSLANAVVTMVFFCEFDVILMISLWVFAASSNTITNHNILLSTFQILTVPTSVSKLVGLVKALSKHFTQADNWVVGVDNFP